MAAQLLNSLNDKHYNNYCTGLVELELALCKLALYILALYKLDTMADGNNKADDIVALDEHGYVHD